MGLWIVFGNENVVFTMGWKKFAETEKGQRVRSNVKVMLTVFLHQGCCASGILTSGTKSESLLLSHSAETSKRECKEKNTSVVEKQLLVPPSWQ
jgi:hypothetical protein